MEPSSPWPNDLPSSVPGHDAPTSPHAPRHEPDFPAVRLERPGDHIGPFKLLDIIGEGGFGVVYLAERREPMVQRVALKIIKPGMDSKAVVARFEQERQALAVMDHPNVAKVFDAGTTPTGRPYFVMEHVKGEPITAFADRHRLTIQQRLELFIPVCDAVQHAHMKGIIHRDLKPSNILVAPAAESAAHASTPALVKVIDFGVAKAISHTLTDKTIFTERGQIIGTPEYMSPEQAEMGATDIDTRSDVYSLGVVLYELLAGVLPFDPKTLRAHGYAEIQRIIREEEAPRPSTKLSTADAATGAAIAKARQDHREALAAQLRRELEWIPLKALRKDRTRRYASAESLGADVRRYLTGKPLEAAPERRGYLFQKFIRRNRVQAIAAGAVCLALVAGFSIAIWQAREASRQRDAAELARRQEARLRADAELATARAEWESYIGNVNAADAALATSTPARLRARLDACPEQLRGWEWRYLDARADRSLMVLRGHSSKVHSVSFDSTGRRLATASEDNTARVWDIETGNQIAKVHADRVIRAVALDETGRILATGTDGGILSLWDAATGRSLANRGGIATIQDIKLSPGAETVVIARLNLGFEIFAGPDLRLSARIPANVGFATGVTLCARDRLLAVSAPSKECEVWDLEARSVVARLGADVAASPTPSVDPTGTRVLSAVGDEKAVMVWDVGSGKELARLTHVQRVRSAEFDPKGTFIVTSCEDGWARVWEAQSGRLVHGEYLGNVVFSSSFSPDSLTVLSLSSNGLAHAWSTTGTSELTTFRGHTDWIRAGAIAPSGGLAATSANDGTIRLWALDSGPEVVLMTDQSRAIDRYEMVGTSLRERSSGRVVATVEGFCDGPLRGRSGRAAGPKTSGQSSGMETSTRWKREVVLTGGGLPDAILVGHSADVNTVAFDHTGTRVVTASDDCTARVWDAGTGMELLTLPHRTRLVAAVFCIAGELLVTLDEDGAVYIWDSVPLRSRRAARPSPQGD